MSDKPIVKDRGRSRFTDPWFGERLGMLLFLLWLPIAAVIALMLSRLL